jgi:hypothetical protein
MALLQSSTNLMVSCNRRLDNTVCVLYMCIPNYHGFFFLPVLPVNIFEI